MIKNKKLSLNKNTISGLSSTDIINIKGGLRQQTFTLWAEICCCSATGPVW